MGELGGGRLAMPGTSSGGTPAERRQEILETTLQAVKRCQVSVIWDADPEQFLGEVWGQAGVGHWGKWRGAGLADQVKLEVSWYFNSCCRLELVLGHGMREPGAPSLGLAVMRFFKNKRKTYKILFSLRNVKDLVSQKHFGPGDSGGIWRMVRHVV